MWAANVGASTISEIGSGGTAVSATGYSGGGLSSARYLVIDGLNHVWVSNATATGQISEFTNAGVAVTPSTGHRGGGMSRPRGIAVDGSGNIRVADFGSNSVTEIVGAAAPVVTPISLGSKNAKLGPRP